MKKIVQKGLLERIELSNIKDQFGDVLVPVEEVVELELELELQPTNKEIKIALAI